MSLFTDLMAAIKPPGESDSERLKAAWRVKMTVVIVSIIGVVSWGFGWIAYPPGSPLLALRASLTNLEQEVTGVKESILCANLKTDIEKNREDLYNIEREIEMAGDAASERQFARRNTLVNTLRDNETRFAALGCYLVFAEAGVG